MAEKSIARVFWKRIEGSGKAPAQMVKRGGEWQTSTWEGVGEIVREVALGLLALGRQPSDTVAPFPEPRGVGTADSAILRRDRSPFYLSTYPPEQIAYIVNDAEVRTLIVENLDQLAKALQVRMMPARADRGDPGACGRDAACADVGGASPAGEGTRGQAGGRLAAADGRDPP
jgi:long-chain acyl-CoA synthetase